MPLLWVFVAPPNRSLSLCLKSVKNLYLSHRFFCEIRQIQLRLKKCCKAISLLSFNLHFATSFHALKSLLITYKRWSIVSCIHDSLRVFFKEKRAFVHEVRCYKPLFVLIDTYCSYKAKQCLFGGKYSPTTRVRFFISLLSLSQRLFVRIQ